MLDVHQLKLFKQKGIIEADLPIHPEHELLRYLLKDNHFTVELAAGRLRQTYMRVALRPAKVVIYEENALNPSKNYNLLYILKIDDSGNLMLQSLNEESSQGMIEYENGYPYILLPETGVPVQWTYYFCDTIQVRCISEFCRKTVDGTEHDALVVTRTYKAIGEKETMKTYTIRETYIAGYGILSREYNYQ